jgi:hypothetical protein
MDHADATWWSVLTVLFLHGRKARYSKRSMYEAYASLSLFLKEE